MEITKETTMGELLNYDAGLGGVLMACGMHCVGCPSHAFESLEDGCAVHGIDVEQVLTLLRRYDAEKHGTK